MKFTIYNLQFTTGARGFTLVELLVVTGIIALLVATATVSFRAQRSSQEINSSRMDTVSKLREVQGNILAGKIISGPDQAADAYIISFTAGSQTFGIDYEINCEVACVRAVLENYKYSTFGTGVTLSALSVNGVPAGAAEVRIPAPYAKITVGGAANTLIVLTLLHTSGQTKGIVIDGISGRIMPQ